MKYEDTTLNKGFSQLLVSRGQKSAVFQAGRVWRRTRKNQTGRQTDRQTGRRRRPPRPQGTLIPESCTGPRDRAVHEHVSDIFNRRIKISDAKV